MVVPNSALRQVTNLSKDWSRAVIDIPVAVTEDLEQVTGLLKDMFADMAADPEWSELLLGDPVVAGVETIDVGLRPAATHRPDPSRPPVRGGPGDPAAGHDRPPLGRRQLAVHRRGVVVTDDRTGSDGTTGPDEPADRPSPASGQSGVGARAPWEPKEPGQDEVRHSALVGFMSVRVGRRFPLRRSTILMAVAFVGLATLLYFNPPTSDSTPSGGAVVGGFYVPGATPVSTTTTTTTLPPSTTTSSPSTTTTQPGRPVASTPTSTSTTTTAPTGGTGFGGTGSAGTGSASTTTTSAGSGQFGATTSTSTSNSG